MSELPEEWVNTDLGDIADFVMGQAPPGTSYNSDGVGTPLVKAGEFGPERPVFDNWTTEPLKLAKASDVLICVVGATSGKINLGADCAIGRSVAAIRPTEALDQLYLYNFLKTRVLPLRSVATGTAQGVISKVILHGETIPLPPLAEQKRIVRKLDTLGARTTAARTHLTAISKLVERQKLAVLGHLFGKSGSDPKPTEHLWAIPASWEWKKVKEIGEVGLGRQRSPENHNGPDMRPYIRSANITWSGVDTTDVKEMNFDEADFERFELKVGDVLLNEGSGSAKEVGKPAIWRGEIPNCCFQNTVLRVQPRDCSSEYLYWYFLLTALSEGFVKDTKGVNIQHIGKGGLANFPIPVPPLEEQDEIVCQIKTALTEIDRIATEAEKALKLTDRLDERILAKAFAGELVPQDPNDEPASVLLDRIRETRAKAPKKTRPRRTKANTSEKKADEMNDKKRSQVSETYLSSLLKQLGGSSPSRELWLKSDMDLNEFYMLLRDEVSAGRIDETQGKRTLVATNAA